MAAPRGASPVASEDLFVEFLNAFTNCAIDEVAAMIEELPTSELEQLVPLLLISGILEHLRASFRLVRALTTRLYRPPPSQPAEAMSEVPPGDRSGRRGWRW